MNDKDLASYGEVLDTLKRKWDFDRQLFSNFERNIPDMDNKKFQTMISIGSGRMESTVLTKI